MVDEITKRLRNYNYLFDKYWYNRREFQYIDGIQRSMFLLFSNELDSQEVLGYKGSVDHNYEGHHGEDMNHLHDLDEEDAGEEVSKIKAAIGSRSKT